MNIIETTKGWIRNFVIEFNLCPFAASVFNSDKILYSQEDSNDIKDQLIAFWNCVHSLHESDQFSTAFIIYSEFKGTFNDFLDVFHRCEILLEETGLNETYQLAGFHPVYLFKDASLDDPANYTNRSPFPMIHIISVQDVLDARNSYPEIEKIPERNIELLRAKGLEYLRNMRF